MSWFIVTRKDLKEQFGNYGNGFASRLAKRGRIGRQFLVKGEWISEPKDRVEDVRYLCDGAFRTVSEAWQYLDSEGRENPEMVDGILDRLYSSIEDGAIILFSPWGPKYTYRRKGTKISEEDKEMETLRSIGRVFERFRSLGFSPKLLLMYADVYGTEINNLPENVVRDYGKSLEGAALSVLDTVEFETWSGIRDRFNPEYQELRDSIAGNFGSFVKPGVFQNMMRKSPPGSTEETTRKYVVERLVEGKMIDRMYMPIKLSLVGREKDVLDGPLPRVYIIPEEARAPWMD